MIKVIKNLATLFRKEKQGNEYQKTVVVLDKPYPVITDVSKVNVSVSGKEIRTIGR